MTHEVDCYNRALPGEPRFTLLARDPSFARMIFKWANDRASEIDCGLRPESDHQMVLEAYELATRGAAWRKEHDGEWRK